jgi:carboxypeptidase C (cathepsin A)
MREFVPEDSPVVVGYSSYGEFRGIGGAIGMKEGGVNIGGLVSVSGHPDLALLNYDKDNVDPRPFIGSLPAIIMTNNYHRGLVPQSLGTESKLFRSADDFSMGDYADLLAQSRMSSPRRNRIVQKLAELTGLSIANLEATNMRINPAVYCAERFADNGQILSVLDGRLRYDAYQTNETNHIDPKLDRIVPSFVNGIRQMAVNGEIPSIFDDPNYMGILPIGGQSPHWPYTGIWEKRRVHEAVLKLIELVPNLQVFDIAGYYDPNCSAPKQRAVWREIQELNPNIELHEHLADDHELFGSAEPGVAVDVVCAPMGHQFAYDFVARRALRIGITNIALQLRLGWN